MRESGTIEGIWGRSVAGAAVALSALMLAVGCGGDESPNVEEPGPPVGQPVLPDLVPSPPARFTSVA